jgi:hypothetical protein
VRGDRKGIRSRLALVVTNSKQQLFDLLDKRVFQPTLTANSLLYASLGDRKLLKSVKKRVHESRVRYIADYSDASAIKTNFLQDLNSKPGQALASDMFVLKLPRFEDIRQDFLALCTKLGV